MSKRRISAVAVSAADWMKFRPYKEFDPAYDGYYLRLSNRIFNILNAPDRNLRQNVERTDLVELAVILASWFEDYANEIGLWNTFIHKNKELYGVWLPFFKMDQYDPEALNPEDPAYLVWHFATMRFGGFANPLNEDFLAIGRYLVEIFEEALDEAPGTEFYDAYLEIPDDVHFFHLKGILAWVGLGSYLIGSDLGKKCHEAMVDYLHKQDPDTTTVELSNKMLYAFQDDYLYNHGASFAAFQAPDFLATTARCSDALRADIRLLSTHKIIGYFVYEDDEKDNYRFRFLQTGQIFLVKRESATVDTFLKGKVLATSIILWRNAWWITGLVMELGDENDPKLQKMDEAVPFFANSEAIQGRLLDESKVLEANFIQFFGGRIAYFKTNAAAEAAFQAEMHFHNQYLKGERPAVMPDLLDAKDFQNGKGSALFYEPNQGVKMLEGLAYIAWLAEQPELSKSDSDVLFFNLFKYFSPAMVRTIIEKHTSRNLQYPVKTELPLLPYLEFWMRFYSPDGFAVRFPNHIIAKT